MAGRKVADRSTVETKSDKSIRLCQQRMGSALKYLALVGNLAGPGYEFSSAHKNQVLTTLQEAVDRVKERFEGKPQQAAGFRLTPS